MSDDITINEVPAVESVTVESTENMPSQSDGNEGVQATENKPENTEQKQEAKKDDFSSKFAALSRREKLLRQKEIAIENKEKEHSKQLEEALNRLKEYEQFEENVKLNPLKALKEKYNKSYEDLTQIALNEGNPTPEMLIQRVREEMDSKYKSEIESIRQEIKKKEEQEAEQEYKNREVNFLKDLTGFVNSNKDKYELTIAENAVDLVYEVMQEHYNKTLEEEGEGRVLSYEEAADKVERYLEEELEKRLKYNKVKSKIAGSPQKPASKEPNKQGQSVTLTNSLSQQAPRADRKLSEDERTAEAAKLLKWTE